MISTTCALEFYNTPADKDAAHAATIAFIASATSTYREMIYEFNDPQYAAELLAAHGRGVDVKLLVDHTQSTTPGCKAILAWLRDQGFPATNIAITTSALHRIMHDKLGIVDGDTDHGAVLEGSLNWSTDAPSQDNTLLLLRAPDLARFLFAAFTTHWDWTLANEKDYQL